jgi:hypothetical protein
LSIAFAEKQMAVFQRIALPNFNRTHSGLQIVLQAKLVDQF